jgi:cytochrome P450
MYMPANTSIILTTVLMQRSHTVWGDDAEEFKLERWLDGGLSQAEREGFMSWNIGPRMVSNYAAS